MVDRGFTDVSGITFGPLNAGQLWGEAGLQNSADFYASRIVNIVNLGDPFATLKDPVGAVAPIGEQGGFWAAMDLISTAVFPIRWLYTLGAAEAFHPLALGSN